jgi:hypothetical protein
VWSLPQYRSAVRTANASDQGWIYYSERGVREHRPAKVRDRDFSPNGTVSEGPTLSSAAPIPWSLQPRRRCVQQNEVGPLTPHPGTPLYRHPGGLVRYGSCLCLALAVIEKFIAK